MCGEEFLLTGLESTSQDQISNKKMGESDCISLGLTVLGVID